MKKILAVDDSATIRQMVKATLTATGHEVLEAVDGQDALQQVAKTQFDLIITDVNMPNLDGIDLTKSLRAIPAYKFTPILILTTEHTPEMKSKGKEAGATGWIIKPFNPEQLTQVVKRVLG